MGSLFDFEQVSSGSVLKANDRPGVIQKPIDVIRAVSWDRNDSGTQVFDRGDVQDAAAEVLWCGTVDALAYVRRGGDVRGRAQRGRSAVGPH